MKKLLLVAPVIVMVVSMNLLHLIGLVSDEAVETVFRRFENF